MFAALAAELAGPAAAGLTACELEELLDERGREVIRQLLQDHFDLRALREEQQAREHPGPVTGPDGITRTRLETGHGRALATLFGTVTVTRCAWRKPGAGNFRPADAALSLPAGRHSHTLAKLAAIEAARGSFDAAHAAITRRCGNGDGQAAGRGVRRARRRRHPRVLRRPDPRAVHPRSLLVMSADCKGIVMRPGALRAATAKAAAKLGKMRTRLSAGEKPNRKRMAALVTVYDAEPAQRRPHDVIAPPGGRHGARELRPGPKALAKWLAGSVRKDPARHDRRRVRRGRGPRPRPPADLGRPRRRGRPPAGPDPRRGRPPRRQNSHSDRYHPRPRIPLGCCLELPRGRGSRRRGLGRGQGPRRPGRRQRPGRAGITAEADAAGLEGSQRTEPTRASATWETSASSCATTRHWTPDGRSRRG